MTRTGASRTTKYPKATQGGCERCGRKQQPLTQAARDRETTEIFGRNRVCVATPRRAGRRARLAEIVETRPRATLELVARTGDRTRKGRRLWTPAFRITRGSSSFATVKTSGGDRTLFEIQQRHDFVAPLITRCFRSVFELCLAAFMVRRVALYSPLGQPVPPALPAGRPRPAGRSDDGTGSAESVVTRASARLRRS